MTKLRKVLLATYYFPPSAAVATHRMLGLARFLPKFGWQPVVVAPPQAPWEPEDAALLTRVPPETPVIRVPFGRGGAWNKMLARCFAMARWLPAAHRACVQAIRDHRPEAIITSSPPACVHYLGVALGRRFRLPWVVCLRDPWIANYPFRMDWTRWFEQIVEPMVMKRADAVIANTPHNLDGLQAAYPAERHKMTYILNGFDPESFPAESPAVSSHSLPARSRLTMLHAGELYVGRDPRALLDALTGLEHEQRGLGWQLRFIGRATQGIFDLPGEVERRRLGEVVHINGQLAYAAALREIVAADLLVLIHTPGLKIGVPAKLYEYLGARRPVLALAEPESDVALVLRQAGVLHRVVSPLDTGKIRQALRELRDEIRLGTAPCPSDRQLHAFTREHMAEQFARTLDRITR